MDEREQIQELISQGKTEEALEVLKRLTSEALLLQSRFNGAKKQYGMGLIDFSEWSRTQAQVNYAALEMMNRVRGGEGPGTISQAAVVNPPVNPTQQTVIPETKKTTLTMPKVFISYNQKDSFAMRSVKAVLDKHGIESFVDINEIGVGDNIEEKILKGLKKCKFIVSLVSENSLRSGWVGLELNTTLVLKNFGKKWIPLLLDKKCFETTFYNQVMSEFDTRIKAIRTEMKTALNKNRGISAFTDELEREENLQQGFDDIIKALKSNLGQDISGDHFDYGMEKVVKAIIK